MKVIPSALPDVLVIEPRIFNDDRGIFYESYNERAFAKETGLGVRFVQDNHSRSVKNVIRGLHYQIEQAQGKLVCVTAGEIYDVAVDIRRSSSYFGKWTADSLSAENHRMIWIPPGFAHGFLVVSAYADVQYKTTDYYAPQHVRTIVWNDPDLAIPWPHQGGPILSSRDRTGVPLREAEVFR